jgi:small conductance mechanosensitive channel
MPLDLPDLRPLLDSIDQPALRGLCLATVGALLVRSLARRAGTWARQTQPEARARLAESLVRWTGFVVVAAAAAETAGFNLGALLATAGFFTVAVGLAAQAGLSNVIAGLFLLTDGPVAVGDLVLIDGRVGTVEGVTLLSTWIRTPDNVLVRWPNDFVLKAAITNYSRQETRRVDVHATLRTEFDVASAREVLLPVVAAVPGVKPEPTPEVVVHAITTFGTELEVRAFVAPVDYLAVRALLLEAVHRVLRGELVAAPPPPAPGTVGLKVEL